MTKTEYMRLYRKKNGNAARDRWRNLDRNRIKIRCHDLIHRLKRRGIIVKQNCEKCGDKNTHAHHDDYSKPLEIRWLCPLHHREHHKLLGEAHLPDPSERLDRKKYQGKGRPRLTDYLK